MAALRHYNIGITLGRLYELKVHGLHCVAVVLYGGFYGTASLCYVTDHDPEDSVVVVCVHEDLDVHLVTKLLAGEDEDTFHDDYLCGLYGDGFRSGTGAGDVGVYRLLYGLSGLELTDLLAHELPVNCVRVVEVDILAFLRRYVTGILVIGILGDYHHFPVKLFSNSTNNSCLS